MNDFFYFGSKLLSSTVQAGPIVLKQKNGLPGSYYLIKGYYEGINFPYVFKQDYGKKFTDILDTGCAGLFLISENLKKILENNRFTGWKTYPIKLYDKKNNEVSGYHGFSVIGSC